jgi:hypothetical protein
MPMTVPQRDALHRMTTAFQELSGIAPPHPEFTALAHVVGFLWRRPGTLSLELRCRDGLITELTVRDDRTGGIIRHVVFRPDGTEVLESEP